MIQVGKNVRSASEPLIKANVEYLYNALRNPKPEIQNRIRQLRIVRNIDPKQYANLKRQLPYFVCGVFNPPFRRTENFAYCSYFVVDIDHISDKSLDVNELREKIESDERVLLSFLSPGEDGLKVLFRLADRCYDAGIYSIFYKRFIHSFSLQYGLEQVVDSRTSDVTRACFISCDPHVYYNADCIAVDMEAHIDSNNTLELLSEKKRQDLQDKADAEAIASAKPVNADVDGEVIDRIKEILGTAKAPKEKPLAYVPEQLNDIIDDLQYYISQTGMIVDEVSSIHYGKKIKASVGMKMAEVNLFFGKRGFSVVQSPRTGTNFEMNELLAALIQSFVAQL